MKRACALALTLLAFAGCDDDDYVPPEDLKAPRDMAVQLDLLTPANRGPADYSLGIAIHGLWWDVPSQTLYASGGDNQILTIDDNGGTHVWVGIDTTNAPLPDTLGQLVRLQDGTIAVTSNGFGLYGSVFLVRPDGTVDSLILDPTRRRIGLTVATTGQIVDTWYVQNGNGTIGAAGISRVDPVAQETDLLMSNFGRPIGIVSANDRLYISDQLFGKIWITPADNPGTLTAFATPSQPGLSALGPMGGLFVAGPAGLYQVSATGNVSDFYKQDLPVEAVAYDPDHKRVFFTENPGPDGGTGATLHIRPVN
jgi:hypothetical protein